ncbi:MAG: ROK family protein [Peptostreptococcus sp.]|uniref:ROK family protein n=1 Tax=Peptostreptococcus sp. TaxID=1262 RepID=UPI002FCB013D
MYLGIDVGGSSIKFAVIDEKLNIIHYETCDTPDNKNVLIVDELYRVASRLKDSYDFSYMGVSTAGVVDTKKMEIVSATETIKNYIGLNFKDKLEERLNVEVSADNDVNCALLGEQLLGCAKGLNEVFCVALGTGIGGAYYLDKMPEGSSFSVGEIGQIMYDPKTGKNFEQRASTIALEQRIAKEIDESISVKDFFDICKYLDSKEKNGKNMKSSVEYDSMDKKLLEMAMKYKDSSRKLMNSWLEDLAEGITNMLLIIDPKYVIIGGAISGQGDDLIKRLEEKIDMFMPIKINKSKLLCASLGNNAAIYGAIRPFIAE